MKRLNKKGLLDFTTQWVEMVFILLFIVGLLVALKFRSPIYNYIFIAIVGLFMGRYLFQKRTQYVFKFILAITGFILGYAITIIITRTADWKIIIILYVLTISASYYMHDKGWIHD